MNIKRNDTIPTSAIKIISGYLECGLAGSESKEAFETMCEEMHIAVGGYRVRLEQAIVQNIINRKAYSANAVIRKFELHISESTFKRYKRRYCYLLARRLRLV